MLVLRPTFTRRDGPMPANNINNNQMLLHVAEASLHADVSYFLASHGKRTAKFKTQTAGYWNTISNMVTILRVRSKEIGDVCTQAKLKLMLQQIAVFLRHLHVSLLIVFRLLDEKTFILYHQIEQEIFKKLALVAQI